MPDLDENVPKWATVSELEEILELSRQTIYKHIRHAHLEPRPDKRYRVSDVMDAILEARRADKAREQRMAA